jgi:CheY-like chemotaxis protein
MDKTHSGSNTEEANVSTEPGSSIPTPVSSASDQRGECLHHKTILIVDDVLVMRLRMRSQLEEAGYRVLEAEDGERALDVIRKETNDTVGIDLIIADISMPVMDGLEFLKRLRQELGLATLPVIVCTARGEIAVVRRAKLLGVQGFLVKPIAKPTLLAAIKRELG